MAYLDGKVALITGAGRGIGREIALMMAGEGARVVVNDLGATDRGEGADSSVAADVIREIRDAGGEAVSNPDSVTSWEGAHRMVQTALDHFGRIDIVVNNAGIARDRMIFKMSEEEWDAVVGVRGKEIYLFSQPRVVRSIHKSDGWSIDDLSQMLEVAMKGHFTPLDMSPGYFCWDPLV